MLSDVTFQFDSNLDWAVFDSLGVRVSPRFPSYDELSAWWATGPELVAQEDTDTTFVEFDPMATATTDAAAWSEVGAA